MSNEKHMDRSLAQERIELEAERQREKYRQWFNSLPELEQYQTQHDKMSSSEPVEHFRQKMGDSGNKHGQGRPVIPAFLVRLPVSTMSQRGTTALPERSFL